MRIIGVVDLAGGVAVHARGGARARYEPVDVPGGRAGDPRGLAAFYREQMGIADLYVADLDAIAGSARQYDIVTMLAAGGAVWLDAGIASVAAAAEAQRRGATKIVVGLETLPDIGALEDICLDVGGDHVVLSLDLRDGRPVTRSADVAAMRPESIAARAAQAGVGAIIVLDLTRVGTGAGVDRPLLRCVRAAAPAVTLLAGGGIAGSADLRAARMAGCDGVLVASALLDGRLTAADVHASSSL